MGEPNIAELAVAAWRLERWLDNLNAERKMAAKKSIREIKKFLDTSVVEIIDPLGWKFDPGLAVEVVNNEAEDVDEDELLIIQTNSPIIKQNGAVIQYGKVVLGLEIKELKANNELRTSVESTQTEPIVSSAESEGILSQGPIYVGNYEGFPCWVRQFDCKATKAGYHALIGVFSNVDTKVCLMDEQVYRGYVAGIHPRNPFIYKPKAGAAYIAPPYPDVWYLIVWPLTEKEDIGTRFDSNCEWAINQDSLKKAKRNPQEDLAQKDEQKSLEENSNDEPADMNDKVEFDNQENKEVTIIADGGARMNIILYGSAYGTAQKYAEELARRIHVRCIAYTDMESIDAYDTVIYIGALYAGGVLGLKECLKKLDFQNKRLLVATVGLADPQDGENIKNIRRFLLRQIPKSLYREEQIFHLRGGIDYKALSFAHKTMMGLLYQKARKLPEEKKTAEVRAMIETYGKQVDFIDFSSLASIQTYLSEQER